MASINYIEPFDPKFPTVNDWTNSAVLGNAMYESTKIGAEADLKNKKKKKEDKLALKTNIKKFNATLHQPRKVGKNQKS